MQDPELNFEQAYEDYRRLGYSDRWINQRLKSIEVRKELTDEWDRAGIEKGQQYASLTDIITKREATIPVFPLFVPIPVVSRTGGGFAGTALLNAATECHFGTGGVDGTTRHNKSYRSDFYIS